MNISGFTTLNSASTCLSTLNVSSTINGGFGENIASGLNIYGPTNTYQSLSFRTSNYNLGVAGAATIYSNSVVQNDMILRTLPSTNLILQSGGGAAAFTINTLNNNECPSRYPHNGMGIIFEARSNYLRN